MKTLREKLGLNQSEFAERLGVGRTVITETENERRVPKEAFWRAIAQLEVSAGLRPIPSEPMPTSEHVAESLEGARYADPRLAIRKAREARHLSIAQLAKLTRLPADVLTAAESGGQRLSERQIDAICRELDLDKGMLMSGSDHPNVLDEAGIEATHGATPSIKLPPGMKGRHVPLLATAEAGPQAGHSDAEYRYTGIFAPNVDDHSAFAIKVSGDSMDSGKNSETDLRDGDLVVCSPKASLGNSEVAVVRTRSEQVFIKYWRKEKDRVVLESANPGYPDLTFPLSEIAGAWPVVLRFQSGKIKKSHQ